jgi:predicted RecB family nuclease
MFVVAPGRCARPERFRVDDYLAYYRRVRSALERAVESPRETYPEPVPHCEVCRWWPECDRRRRADDHLSLVAGATRLQRRELAARGLETVEKLARTRLPFDPRPARGSLEAFPRTYDQARVQLASRGARTPAFESIEPTLGRCGLGRLPAPSPGDVFFDLEGDPFVADGGREYLFGWAVRDEAGRP